MKTTRLNKRNSKSVIAETNKILQKGGLVIAPTDTVYGLLVDARNEEAVKKLITFKNRPRGKPISVFVSDFKMLDKYVTVGNGRDRSLLNQILPGPFTIILKSKHLVNKQLESEKGTLGIRIPNYTFINRLIDTYKKPVTATSANISGRLPHYSVDSLLKQLPQSKKNLIGLIIDAGKLDRNKPSTVVDLTGQTLKILRRGDIVFAHEKIYISESPKQTKKIAQFTLKKFIGQNLRRPLIFIIKGELGVGKTIFVKGIGEYFGIDRIISPTYVVSYEYEIKRGKMQNLKFKIMKLIHYDLYNIQDQEQFKYLGIEQVLRKGNVLCFEWGEKTGEIYELLQDRGRIIHVNMEYKNKKTRTIKINF